MELSRNGYDLIKRYEGLRLKAYKPVPTEKYWTIGFGHYGADVTENMTITKEQADIYLIKDVSKSVKAVNDLLDSYTFTQNQFDALVSFTFNCGAGNLTKLTNKKSRTLQEIADKLPAYNKAGGKELAGLTRRRQEERALFCEMPNDCYYPRYCGASCKLDDILKAIGVPDKYIGAPTNRIPLAEANGIEDYKGTYGQNIKLNNLAKQGKLRKVV